MNPKKVIGIAFSDLHIHDYSKFNKNNSRTLNHFDVITQVTDLCSDYKCPAFFIGDLFHRPEFITQSLLKQSIEFFKDKVGQWPIYCISGNHDTPYVTTIDGEQVNYIDTLSKVFPSFIIPVHNRTIKLKINGKKFAITGLNYIDHNIGVNQWLKEYQPVRDTICMLHTDYQGAKDTDGSQIDSVENLNTNLLKSFKLVLLGHIHQPQRLGKKTYMVGAPLQQRRTDKNCEDLGYLIIYDDFSVEWKKFDKQYPRFIDVSSDQDIKDDGNYYTLIEKSLESFEKVETSHGIEKSLSKTKIAKRYLKHRGIKDEGKKKILIKVLKDSE